MPNVCLALGANIGDRLGSLQAAVVALQPYIRIKALSRVYDTDPVYATDQPLFLNAALVGETDQDPNALLYTIKDIERDLGRTPTFRYGPRMIDIDILYYDQIVHHSSELTIPHALLHERLFVLRPMADVAADWRHPVLGKTVQDLLSDVSDDGGVRASDHALTLPPL